MCSRSKDRHKGLLCWTVDVSNKWLLTRAIMKAPVCAVFVLIAMAVRMEPVLADEEGGEVASCSLTAPEGKTMWTLLDEKLFECSFEFQHIVDNETEHANTSADYRLAVKHGCENEAAFMKCLDTVKVEAQGCLAGVERTMAVLQAGLLKDGFVVTCEEDGVRAAILEEEVRKPSNWSPEGSTDVLSHCKLKTYRLHAVNIWPDDDPNRGMKKEYHVLKDFIECLENLRGQGHDLIVDASVTNSHALMERMKCINTEDGTEILCKTLISN